MENIPLQLQILELPNETTTNELQATIAVLKCGNKITEIMSDFIKSISFDKLNLPPPTQEDQKILDWIHEEQRRGLEEARLRYEERERIILEDYKYMMKFRQIMKDIDDNEPLL